ncbi:MAG TPA: glycosyltransferase family 1 protein [Patescibacteria group bacterium]|nr:glycosyltransferase family 1 protein [Patescibacteria group bacterium]
MRIGINGFEAVIPRFGFDEKTGLPNRVGSSEVCFQLLSELYKIDKTNEYIIFLPTSPTKDMPEERPGWRYEIIPNKKLWTITGLTPNVLKKTAIDVLFSPTHYSPIFTPIPEVISILDVSYKYFPELFKKQDLLKLSIWGKYSIKKAAAIVTISESSKNDIIKEYQVPEAKIAVLHLGIKDLQKSSMTKSEFIKKYNIEKPYVLFVGTLQPRKNLVRLIHAFSKIDDDYELIIIGRRGWDYEDILTAPAKFGVGSRVRFLEGVNDSELALFYENAEVFVLPSLYEGFGLPVLEAMRYGCPVVTSNISSLPEAGGDAALYFDPEDPDDIASIINKVLKDKKLRDKMIKEGHNQVKKFSWEKAAKEALSVFESIAKN